MAEAAATPSKKKKMNGYALTFGIISGLLAIVLGTLAYMYHQDVKKGLLVRIDPTTGKPVAGSVTYIPTGGGATAPKTTDKPLTLPTNTRILPGTMVMQPDGSIVDLHTLVSQN